MFKNQNGITMIALVVTIIVLIIIVGISVALATNNGLIDQAIEAEIQKTIAEEKEKIKLAYQACEIDFQVNGVIINASTFDTEMKNFDKETEVKEVEGLLSEEQQKNIVVDREDRTSYGEVTFKATGHKYYVAFIDYDPNLPRYTIIYDANGGKNAPVNGVKIQGYNYTISTAKPLKDGYSFVGWSTSQGSSEVAYSGGEIYTINADLNLFAIWTLQEYTITYNLNGGTLVGENPTKYTALDVITLINPTRDTYAFLGWTGTDMINPNKNITIVNQSGDRTYTANWEEAYYLVDGITYAGSLENALSIASNGSTIRVLRDVTDKSTEIIVDKEIILELADNVITADKTIQVTETGNLKILSEENGARNGKIENSTTVAINNKGILQLGEDEGNMKSFSPRISGKEIGIETTGIFKMYDGEVEGDVAIEGDNIQTPTGLHAMAEVNGSREIVRLGSLGDAVVRIGYRYYSTIHRAIETIGAEKQETITLVTNVSTATQAQVVVGNKNVVIDIAGYQLDFEDTLLNEGKLEIQDSSNEKTGEVLINKTGTSSNYVQGILNRGELVLAAKVRTPSNYIRLVQNEGESKFRLTQGGQLITSSTYTYGVYNIGNSNSIIETGSIITTPGTKSYSIYTLEDSNTEITGGTITSGLTEIYITGNSTAKISNISTEYISVAGEATVELAGEISGKGIAFTSNSTGNVNANINLSSSMSVSNNAILNINGGNILAYSISSLNSGTVNINNGQINSTSSTVISASDTSNINVLGGIVSGKIGIRMDDSVKITIGNKDGNVNIETPQIIGTETYGISGIEGGTVKFYDGKITGKTTAIEAGIEDIEVEYNITKERDSSDNEIAYLERKAVAQIGEETFYTLFDAINSIENNTTEEVLIKMINDHANTQEINIENRNITLDLNGFRVDTNEGIINTGTLRIIDNSVENTGIINATVGGTNSNNMIIIDNLGTLELSAKIQGDRAYTRVIQNKETGILKILEGAELITIKANSVGIYNETTNDIEILGGIIKIYEGSSNGRSYGIVNASTGTIDISNLTIDLEGGYYWNYVYGIQNNTSGEINITNIKIDFNPEATCRGIFNSGAGKVNISNGQNIEIGPKNEENSNEDMIYNQSTGEINISNVKMKINGAKIYNYSTGKINITSSTINYDGYTTNVITSYGTGLIEIVDSSIIQTGTVTATNPKIIQNNKGIINVNNTEINGMATNTVGINNYSTGTINILNGSKIIAGKIGIENTSTGTVNIGTEGIPEGEVINIQLPEIQGETYGVYMTAGNLNFYDGRIKGKTDSVFGAYSALETGYSIIKEENEYKESYLGQVFTAQIGENKYLTLEDAVNSITEGTSDETTIKIINNIVNGDTNDLVFGDRNIILDLNGYILEYKKIFSNSKSLKIIDTSAENTGILNYSNTGTEENNSVFIENNGLLEISATVQGNSTYTKIIANKENGRLKILDEANIINTNRYSTCIYNESINDLEISGGIIEIRDADGNAIYNNSTGTIKMTSGTINLYAIGDTYGINNISTGTIDMLGGKINLELSSSRIVAYAIYNNDSATVNIENFEIKTDKTNKYNDDYGIYNNSNGQINILNSSIQNQSRGIYNKENGKVNITTSNINIDGPEQRLGYALDNNSGDIEIIDSNISTYGVWPTAIINKIGNININNTPVSSETGISNGGTGTINILNGSTVTGSDIGIENVSTGIINIGTKDNNVSIENPSIQGNSYGVENLTGTLNFYDGIIKGKTNSIYGNITEIESGTNIKIVEGEYEEAYLSLESVVEIDGVGYTSIQAAADSIPENSAQKTIKVITTILEVGIEDTIIENKDIILDLNGNTVTSPKTMANTGTLKIIDSSVDKTGVINFNRSGTVDNYTVLIRNTGTLEIQAKLENKASYTKLISNEENGQVIIGEEANILVYNYGYGVYSDSGNILVIGGVISLRMHAIGIYNDVNSTISVNGLNMTVENVGTSVITYGIYNKGTAQAIIQNTNMTFTGEKYGTGIYNENSGDVILDNVTSVYKTYGRAETLINKGTAEHTNTINIIDSNYEVGIINNSVNSTMNISNSTIDKSVTNYGTLNVLEGAKILSISNQTTGVCNILAGEIGSVSVYASAIANSGTVYMTGGIIRVTGSGYSSGAGIDNNGGTAYITGGEIYATGDVGYGVRNNQATGKIVIGTEGGEVGTTSPIISSELSYAIVNSVGTVEFYDGILKANKNKNTYYGEITKIEEGYQLSESINGEIEEGILKPVGGDVIVATINGVNYGSLQDAISSSVEGDEIVLRKEVILETSTLEIEADKKVIIDLNGNRIISNSNVTILNSGELEIRDTSSASTGTVENTVGVAIVNNNRLVIGNNADSVNLNSPKIIGGTKGIESTGTLLFYDGIVLGAEAAIEGTIDYKPLAYRVITTTENGKQKMMLESEI